jgi:hypothetical protein
MIRYEEHSREVGHALTLHPCISETAYRYRSSSPDSDFFVVAVESHECTFLVKDGAIPGAESV